jgi:hypothetical protein
MIETALIKLMALHNIHVDRPVVPLHMEVFSDEDEDPQMYPVKVYYSVSHLRKPLTIRPR